MIPKELYNNLDKLRTFCASFWLKKELQVDEDLLITTFIHKTYSADFRESLQIPHNERLEFLWDSILGAHVAEMLYTQFPDQAESQLTLSKIYLVKEPTLAEVAREIDLWSYMFLGNGEERSWGRDKNSVLSDGLEALIAYLYLVWWNSVVDGFIRKYIVAKLDEQPLPTKSFKSKIQELCQKLHKELPEYVLVEKEVEQSGNVLLYEATLSVQWVIKWIWTGPSKKKAQESAAENAYNDMI